MGQMGREHPRPYRDAPYRDSYRDSYRDAPYRDARDNDRPPYRDNDRMPYRDPRDGDRPPFGEAGPDGGRDAMSGEDAQPGQMGQIGPTGPVGPMSRNPNGYYGGPSRFTPRRRYDEEGPAPAPVNPDPFRFRPDRGDH